MKKVHFAKPQNKEEMHSLFPKFRGKFENFNYEVTIKSRSSKLEQKACKYAKQNTPCSSLLEQPGYSCKKAYLSSGSTDTITNLTSIVKDNMVQSQEKFQQTAKDLMWFNITVHAQSEIFTSIRQNLLCCV